MKHLRVNGKCSNCGWDVMQGVILFWCSNHCCYRSLIRVGNGPRVVSPGR